MIRLFLLSLLTIVGVLWLTLYIGFPDDPGYLLVAFDSYTFETSLLAFLVAIIFGYMLIKLVALVLRSVNPLRFIRLTRSISERIRTKSRSDTLEGLLYFARGNWRSSYNLLTKSINDQDGSVINLLAAGYAAHKAEEEDASMKCLDEAEAKYPEIISTIKLMRAKLLYEAGRAEQAELILRELKNGSPNDMGLLKVSKDVYKKLEDWSALKNLVPKLEKYKAINSEELEKIQMRIFVEELYKTSGEDEDKNGGETHLNLKKVWKKGPLRFRVNEKIVNHYANLLIKSKAKEDASIAIEKAISKEWSNLLVSSYGKLDLSNCEQQLKAAEKWLKKRPADANLLLCLGRISMKNKLWEKAKKYFEESIRLSPSAEAYGELSRMLKYLSEGEVNEEFLRNYTDFIDGQLPEISLVDRNEIAR